MKPSCLNVVGKESLGQLTRAKKLERRCERELNLGGNPSWVTSMGWGLRKTDRESRASYWYWRAIYLYTVSFLQVLLSSTTHWIQPIHHCKTSPPLDLWAYPGIISVGVIEVTLKDIFLFFFFFLRETLGGKSELPPNVLSWVNNNLFSWL